MKTIAPVNCMGHALIFTVQRGNGTVTYSAGIQDHEYMITKLYDAARDPFSDIISFSAPSEFFDILAEQPRVVFDSITDMLPRG